jgi:DNA-directed RNA polymerase specialized sigma24 family protein
VTHVAYQPLATVAARAHPDLLRLAVLLERDRADAEDLVRTALVAAGTRRRGSADLMRSARTALVRGHLAGRPDDGPRTSGWVDDVPTEDPDDDLRRALDALPSPTRAAVVLALGAGLPPRDVADVLRMPEDAARAEIAAGAAPLRSAVAPVAPSWRPLTAAPVVDRDADLRRELADLAERLAGWTADAAGTGAEVAAEVSARRRRRRLVALAAACALAAGTVVVATGQDPAPAPAADRDSSTPPPPLVDVTDFPTRGSLADDVEFLDAMTRRQWAGAPTAGSPVGFTPAPGTVRVAFAGDVPGGRWALLVAEPEQGDDRPAVPPDDDVLTAWFTGRPGAPPRDMELSTHPYPLGTGTTPALLDPATGTLVVVAAPGDAVEVSERAEVDADGITSRTWRSVDTADGVAVARLAPMALPWTWAVSYRVLRDGSRVLAAPPVGLQRDPQPGLPDFGIDYRGAIPTTEGRQAAEWAAFAAVASVGLAPDDARITARLVAPVPSPAEGTVALVTVALPSGALLVTGQWASALPQGRPGGADCGMDVRPAGLPPEQRVLAAGCELFAPAEGRSLDSVLVVTAPSSVALVRAYRGDGVLAGEWPVEDGRLVVPMPPGVREVEAVTASGVQLGRSELLGHWRPAAE